MSFLILAISLAVGCAAFAAPAYTNHAGLAVSGFPLRLEAKFVTLSNETETVRVPLSIFPERERRRLAADCGSTRFVPEDVRRALAGLAEQTRRADARFAKDLITPEDRDAVHARAAAQRKTYLDRAVETGRITEPERFLLK